MKVLRYFPLYSPNEREIAKIETTLIVADLRKDNSKIALFSTKNGDLKIEKEKVYPTFEFNSLSELIQLFISEHQISGVKILSISAPGPVMLDKCETPNLPWSIDTKKLQTEIGFDKISLINDLKATAYSLADSKEDTLEIIHKAETEIGGNVAILAPGNGLGEAGLFHDGKALHPFSSEGGHTEFSPRNDFEVDFYQFLNKIYGIVTWEKALSKEGLHNIYRFLRDVGRHEEQPWLTERLQKEDFVSVICSVAKEKSSRLVNLTVEMFLEFLAREANNLVLKLKATGGLIITGEITDLLFDLIDKKLFYKNFLISDQMENLLKDTSIYILRSENSSLEGAAYFGAFIDNH
ncbi:MAG: glucokinase [Bergeyella zoohelcum]|nr:glucokinase [Bergeyella zoohelcum]